MLQVELARAERELAAHSSPWGTGDRGVQQEAKRTREFERHGGGSVCSSGSSEVSSSAGPTRCRGGPAAAAPSPEAKRSHGSAQEEEQGRMQAGRPQSSVSSQSSATFSGVEGSATGSGQQTWLTQQQKEYVDGMMADLVARHGQELQSLQLSVADSQSREALKKASNARLLATVMQLQKALNGKEKITACVVASREAERLAEDERDDLMDKLVGLMAKQDVGTRRHTGDLAEVEKAHRVTSEELLMRQEVSEDRIREELRAAEAGIEKARKLGKEAVVEREDVRQAELTAATAHKVELNYMQERLDATKREIGRSEAAEAQHQTQANRMADGSPSRTATDLLQCCQLEELLGDARHSNHELSEDLTALRVEMFTMKQKHADQALNLQAKLDTANGQPAATLGAPQGRMRLRKQVPAAPLVSIDEEMDDEVASQAASAISGQVSMEDADVADLSDFADDEEAAWALQQSKHPKALAQAEETLRLIAALRGELVEAETRKTELHDEATMQDAENVAKVSRLLQQIQGLKRAYATDEAEVARLMEIGAESGTGQEEEREDLRRQLLLLRESMETDDQARAKKLRSQQVVHATTLEELRDQVAFALESSRLEGVRLEDTLREVDAVQQRHRQAVADLQVRVQLASGRNTPATKALERDVEARLRDAEEERTSLRHEIQLLRLRAEGELGRERAQHAVVINEVAKVKSLLATEKEVNEYLKKSVTESRRDLEVSDKAKEKAEETARTLRAASLSPLAWLRCPARSPQAGPQAKGVDEAAGLGVSCQGIVWQVLGTLHQACVVLCEAESLRVVDASRAALATWGSSLRGASALMLTRDEVGAAWLQSELAGGVSRDTPSIRQIGCIELHNRLGSCFDSSVLCARLAPEPDLARGAAVLLVVEPLEPPGGPPAAPQRWGLPVAARSNSCAASHPPAPRSRRQGIGGSSGHGASPHREP